MRVHVVQVYLFESAAIVRYLRHEYAAEEAADE